MPRTVYILNGPNLNLLGKREPHIYGHTTLREVERRCAKAATALGLTHFFGQSNEEGRLISWVHEARDKKAGVIINPAGYSFTSIALMDALKALEQPIIEVHITNIHRREALYHKSLVSLTAVGVICGLGPLGYELALTAMAEQYQAPHAVAAKRRRS